MNWKPSTGPNDDLALARLQTPDGRTYRSRHPTSSAQFGEIFGATFNVELMSESVRLYADAPRRNFCFEFVPFHLPYRDRWETLHDCLRILFAVLDEGDSYFFLQGWDDDHEMNELALIHRALKVDARMVEYIAECKDGWAAAVVRRGDHDP